MTDKIESELAEGIEEDLGIKAMAARLAPRGLPYGDDAVSRAKNTPLVSQTSIEQKLQAIERLITEIRMVSAQIKGQLG